MSLNAMNNRVIIRPDPEPDKSAGGIVIPGIAKDGIVTIYGTALSIGPLCNQTQVGSRYCYNKWHGLEIVHNGEKLLAIREEELLAEEVEQELHFHNFTSGLLGSEAQQD